MMIHSIWSTPKRRQVQQTASSVALENQAIRVAFDLVPRPSDGRKPLESTMIQYSCDDTRMTQSTEVRQ